ncbi:MAG TPA: DUF952 domain-containing protein [Hyphomicrobiaceae bacterium]|nr:DUF952 domain-containing protein [Hyphomicrobiaceae bacterium]
MTTEAAQKFSVLVYKICSSAEWHAAVRRGSYVGSADDLRDGFIHLSAADQVARTAARHFAGRSDLVLVALASERLKPGLRWEPSRCGALFPHHYGSIDVSAAVWVKPMPMGPGGVPLPPADIAPC